MFCSHCGNQTAPGVKICSVCAQDVMTGDNYCTQCGQVRLPGDEKCVNCGAELFDVIRLAEEKLKQDSNSFEMTPPPIITETPPPFTQPESQQINQSGPKYLPQESIYCRHCGLIIKTSDSKCPYCDTPVGQGSTYCQKCGSGTIASDTVCSVCSSPLTRVQQPNYIPTTPPSVTNYQTNHNVNITNSQSSYYPGKNSNVGDKTFMTTLLLCLLPLVTGINGAHRLYTGHIFIGLLQLITFGGCGLWQLIDFIMILTDSYQDSDGKKLRR